MWALTLYSSTLVAVIASLGYIVLGAIYRLYFSPIAKFPGPTLAALTFWYEFYYDVCLGGQYTFRLPALHAKYGPIIRINPCELHVSDPDYYETLYASSASGEKRNKWKWFTKQFPSPTAMASTPDHGQHKPRRAALNRFFSAASIRKLQPVIDERVEQLIKRLRESTDAKGRVIPMNVAFAAFTNDVVMEYSYGRSDHRLEADDFAPDYHDAAITAARSAGLIKHMFWISAAIQRLPHWLLVRLMPDFNIIIQLQRAVQQQVIQMKAQPKSTFQSLSHPTLFHELLQSHHIPDSEKSIPRITDEALTVVGAGTLTTAWTLSVATYHLLASPRILARLKTELVNAIPDPNAHVDLLILESLPYLTAVIQESLRLSYGVPTRLQRISPDKSLFFTDIITSPKQPKKWRIPPGTPVGMTSFLMHHDETIFPDSHSFVPERWLGGNDAQRLERYMVSFSKGSRQCLGMQLAYAELRLCLAAVFRRFGSTGGGESKVETEDGGGGKGGSGEVGEGPRSESGCGVRSLDDEGVLELYHTDLGDVKTVADGFVPLAKEGSKGIRIVIRN